MIDQGNDLLKEAAKELNEKRVQWKLYPMPYLISRDAPFDEWVSPYALVINPFRPLNTPSKTELFFTRSPASKEEAPLLIQTLFHQSPVMGYDIIIVSQINNYRM